jgi:hypothetical protein
MAKATLFLLIAAAAGLLVYLLAAPRLSHVDLRSQIPLTNRSIGSTPETAPKPSPSSKSEVARGSTHADSTADTVDTAPAIDVPLTNAQRSQKDLEARRGPLYDWVRTNMHEILVGWQPASTDPATLDLYMARESYSADISLCMNNLVEPYATRYGFSHVQFFVPNPPTDAAPWRLDSEATPDANGNWHLYKK